MENQISVIGGDGRIGKLSDLLANDEINVKTFLLDKYDFINENVDKCENLQKCIYNSDFIVSSIPFSKDGKNIFSNYSEQKILIDEIAENLKNKVFIAGKIPNSIKNNINIKSYDLMENERFAILNTIPSAEGAIQVAMENYPRTINSSKVLILGFGRIGKILSRMLIGFGCKIFCEARKNEDLAYIKAYGYDAIHLNNLNKILGDIDIIFNTIPVMILNKEKIDLLKEDILIVDLASNPGGVDFEYAREKNIKTIWALGLPGKVAPLSSAEYIKDIIYDIIKK